MAGSGSNYVITPSLNLCDEDVKPFLLQYKDFRDGKINNINQDAVYAFSKDISDSGISFAKHPFAESVEQGLSIKNKRRKEITDNEMGMEKEFEMSAFDFIKEDGHYLELNDLLRPLSPSPAPSCLDMESDYYFDSLDFFRDLDDVSVITTEDAVVSEEGVSSLKHSDVSRKKKRMV